MSGVNAAAPGGVGDARWHLIVILTAGLGGKDIGCCTCLLLYCPAAQAVTPGVRTHASVMTGAVDAAV